MQKRLKIGLALGSGGPRGLAHIGVIKALTETGIPIDVIAGTSVGAMMGGLYLNAKSIKDVEDSFVNLTIKELATMFSDVAIGSGLIKGERLENYLDGFIDGVLIEDLPCPFSAVASNLENGRYVEITTGNLTKAIRASSSLPGFFNMIKLDESYMIDGGVTQPVPVKTARTLGADYVIAVNLDQYDFSIKDIAIKNPGATKIGLAAIKLLRYSLALEQCSSADMTINPQVAEMVWMNLTHKADRIEIIKRGYEAMMEQVEAVKMAVGI